MGEDHFVMNDIINTIGDFRQHLFSNSQSKMELLSNFNSEYDIQKKIMLISLTLASDPSVSLVIQRQRRDFYEKSKLKVGLFQSLYYKFNKINFKFFKLSKLEKKIEKENERTKGAFEFNQFSSNFNDRKDSKNSKNF